MNECLLMEELIHEKHIRTVYQPIVALETGQVMGYEALSRGPEDTEFENPIDLIELADLCGMSWELDWAFRSLAIERAQDLQPDQLLFINVDPKIIYDEAHEVGMTREILNKNNISPDSVIFEITERTAIDDYNGFNKILQNYVDQGYKIAIDDVGAGYSGMNRILETRPQFLKMDMNLIRDIHKDSFKQAIVKSFVQLGNNTNIRIIAEGIETKEELKTLIKLGVHAAQGYYLSKPSTKLLSLPNQIKSEILKYNQILASSAHYSASYHYIGSVAEQVRSVPATMKCKEVEQFFKQHGSEALCILDRHRIQGIITRSAFSQAMSGQYGHAVYSNREVSLIMDQQPLIVDYYTPVNKVAELAIDRSDQNMYDAIIVKRGSFYYGLVSVKHLLQFAIEYERDYARELNPLTQLPGNQIINRVLNDVLVYEGQYAVFYFDLDHFKAYNDIYGFDNGDKIIKMTSRLLLDFFKQHDAVNTFVGHIGGDDFVAVMTYRDPDEIKQIVLKILEAFDREITAYYNEKDQKLGLITAEDRNGNLTTYPLMSLSAACLCGDLKSIGTTAVLGKIMADIKKTAKKKSGSSMELILYGKDEFEIKSAASGM